MKARVVWLILCGIWGSTWLFIKLGLNDLPPLTFAGIRFLCASSILVAIIFARGVRWPRKRSEWLLIAIVGWLQFSLNYGLVFWGEQRIPSGLAAVLQSTFPAFGLVIAHFYLPEERITPKKLMGVLLGVLGVGIVFSDQLSFAGKAALAGSVALVLSAVCGSYGNVLVKAYGTQIDPFVLAAGQMVCGFPPLLALGIATEGNPIHFHWTATAVIALAYLVIVGSVIAFTLFYWLVRHMDVVNTMLIALVTPVVAVLLGMIVLHEKFNWRLFAGAACIISGIGLIMLRKRQKSVAIDEEEPEMMAVG
ncbi:MAG TPA: EamA family transporter [Pyrinomonadaceae bacterium]|jgi:drug/metabolite transporter (DMT)-like permease|nr:EamA family transporter [Pyrinomonadaceae bacterium]